MIDQVAPDFVVETHCSCAGFVYFARAGAWVKVGKSGNPAQRISALQTANPHQVELLGTLGFCMGACGGGLLFGDDAERVLHRILEPVRVRGEWFADGPFVRWLARCLRPDRLGEITCAYGWGTVGMGLGFVGDWPTGGTA